MINKVWLFDINKRVYEKNENGRNTGGPIWREHWREHQIVDETRISYITRGGSKVPKKGGPGIAFSEEEIDRAEMIAVHAHRIAEQLNRCKNPDLLIEVARMIGYQCKQVDQASDAAVTDSADPLSQPVLDNANPKLT